MDILGLRTLAMVLKTLIFQLVETELMPSWQTQVLALLIRILYYHISLLACSGDRWDFELKTSSPALEIVNLWFTLERIKSIWFQLGNWHCGRSQCVFSVTSQEVTMEMIMVLWIQNYNYEWEISCLRRENADE
jgi:hypothetical protein